MHNEIKKKRREIIYNLYEFYSLYYMILFKEYIEKNQFEILNLVKYISKSIHNFTMLYRIF